MTVTATTAVPPATRREWVRQTWGRPALRRVAYAALALPLAIGVVVTSLVGGGQAALGLDRLGRRRWLGDEGPLQARPGRVLAYALVSVPLGFCEVFILLLRGLVGLQTRLREGLLQDRSTWWTAPVTIVVIAGLGIFLVALLRQL